MASLNGDAAAGGGVLLFLLVLVVDFVFIFVDRKSHPRERGYAGTFDARDALL